MKKPNITPGDWSRCSIAHIVEFSEEKSANRRAISALPQCLEALENCAGRMTDINATVESLIEAGELRRDCSSQLVCLLTLDEARNAILAAGYTEADAGIDLQSSAFDLAEGSLTPAQA